MSNRSLHHLCLATPSWDEKETSTLAAPRRTCGHDVPLCLLIQMNGRLVRKTLSFSKQRKMLEAACAWEDWVVGRDPLDQDLAGAGAG
jgi:hypothetical protein